MISPPTWKPQKDNMSKWKRHVASKKQVFSSIKNGIISGENCQKVGGVMIEVCLQIGELR